MSSEVFYCRSVGNGRYMLGSIVNGADYPLLRNVSEEDARRTGQQLLEAGVELGPEFEINCTANRRRTA